MMQTVRQTLIGGQPGAHRRQGRIGLRDSAPTYPCRVVGRDEAEAGARSEYWRGLSAGCITRATEAVAPQRDDWSCMTNSAARVAAAVSGGDFCAAAYQRFKATCPLLHLRDIEAEIRDFFHDHTGDIYAAIRKHQTTIGPTPQMLAPYVASRLGVQVGLLKQKSARACELWLQQSSGPACAAVLLMAYGHMAMHYVGFLGYDARRDCALLLETSGELFAMDMDVVISSMDARDTVAYGMEKIARFNALRITPAADAC